MLSLVKSKPRARSVSAQVNAVPEHLVVSLQDVVHLVGGSAANGDNSDPVVCSGDVELQLRRVVARYGFDRLPLTFGELQGLLAYCEELDTTAGIGMMTGDALRAWQESALSVQERLSPHLVPALRLYIEGNLVALAALHRESDTLAVLGQRYRQFKD